MSSLRYPKSKGQKRGSNSTKPKPPVVGAPSQSNMASRAARLARQPQATSPSPRSPVTMATGSWQPPRPRPSSTSEFDVTVKGDHTWMGWGKGPDTEALSVERARDERLKSALDMTGVRDRDHDPDRPASSPPARTASAKSKGPASPKPKSKSTKAKVKQSSGSSSSPKPKKRIVPRYPTLQSSEHRVVPSNAPVEAGDEIDSSIYRQLLSETTSAAEAAMNELVSDGGDFERHLLGDAGVARGGSDVEVEALKRLNQRPRESYPAAPVGSRTQIYAPRESCVSENGASPTAGATSGAGDARDDGDEVEVEGAASSSKSNLVTVMATRLNKLERLVRRLNTELSEKESELKSLRRDAGGRISGSGTSSQVHHLQKSNDKLRRELHSIHAFLADYGLTWVGEPDSDEEDGDGDADADGEQGKSKAKKKKKNITVELGSAGGGGGGGGDVGDGQRRGSVQWGGTVSPRSPYRHEAEADADTQVGAEMDPNCTYDVRALLMRIKELNILAGDGTTAFKRGADGRTHKLHPPSSLPLVLYRDGILLRAGPFRPLSDTATRLFLTDIHDGFFPYELRGQFPDGVVFDVTDRSSDLYSKGKAEPVQSFPGMGQVLGGNDKPPVEVRVSFKRGDRDQGAGADIHQLTDARVPPSDVQLRPADLLRRLPGTVVRGGNVVRVREELEGVLGWKARGDEPRVVQMVAEADADVDVDAETQTDTGDGDGVGVGDGDGGAGAGGSVDLDIATLRVKSRDLSVVYVAKLPRTATIGELRLALEAQFASDGDDDVADTSYVLRTAFPPQTFGDYSATLGDCGLFPSATLFMK